MRRSETVRALFWELRAAGVDGSARDILRLADLLLRSHKGEIGGLGDFGRVVDSRAFPFLPVDVVINRAGWRVVDFENSRVDRFDIDTVDSMAGVKKAERLVGKLWPRSTPQD